MFHAPGQRYRHNFEGINLNTKTKDVGSIFAELSALSKREQHLRQLFAQFQSALKNQETKVSIDTLSIEEHLDESSTRGSRSRITFANRQAELFCRTAHSASSSVLIGQIFVYLMPAYPQYPESKITHINTIEFNGSGEVLNNVLNFTTHYGDKVLVTDDSSVYYILLQLLCDMTN